jgi:hypothetical protein
MGGCAYTQDLEGPSPLPSPRGRGSLGLQGLSEQGCQTHSGTQHLETRGRVMTLEISRPGIAIGRIQPFAEDQSLRLIVPAFDHCPPLGWCVCRHGRLCSLHTLPQGAQLLGKGWGIIRMHKAGGCFNELAVPYGVQVRSGTTGLAIYGHEP